MKLSLFFLIVLTSCAARTNYPPLPIPVPPHPYLATPLPPMPREPMLPKNQLGYTIILDPGHGGDDFGTRSNTKPTYLEKYLNLSAAKMLDGFLSQIGYNTILTRNEDIFIPLEKRAEFANDKKCKLFVSIHFNSAPSPEAEGIEVFYYRSDSNTYRTKESKLLAKSILDKIILQTQAKSRGVKHGNFAVIRLTQMPAVLVEGGFLTNDKEMEKIKDPAYLKKLMWGIAQGIHQYVRAGGKESTSTPLAFSPELRKQR